MSVKIKKINIHAFRGIPDLELELEGKNLLLRGENGTGKSSVVEAIEFFFTGKVSRLEGVRGLSLRRHGPHVNFRPGDVNVGIAFDPGNISLNRTFTSAPSPPPPLEDYFQKTQKGTFILRRSQILEFIISQPAERFRAIGSIIGIEPLDNVELEMMRLRDELEGKVASKVEMSNRLIKDLSDVIGKDIVKVKDVLPALNDVLQKANLPSIVSLEDIEKHAEEMLRSVKKAESIDKIGILNETLSITSTPFISQEVVDQLNNLNEKVRYLLQDQIRIELSIAGLLESGRRVIEQEKMDTCPLCEQKINRERLVTRIDGRLRILRDLSDKSSEIRRVSVPIIDTLRSASHKITSTISKIELFPELSVEKKMLSNELDFLNGFMEKVASAKEVKNEIPIQDISQGKDRINRMGASI
ncbi:MAG: AAA family ATPase [Thermoplasmata archaeon]